MHQIFFDDITIQLDDRTAFDHTTWHILGNQNWAVIGGTGAGKSLLLKSICRKVPLFHGRICYEFDRSGEKISRQYLNHGEILLFSPETLRNFQHRYASYYQAKWHSFEGDDVPFVKDVLKSREQNIDNSPDANATTTDDIDFHRRWSDAVEMFKLGPILNRKIHHLSDGESRKVFIARLLMQEPQLLILDDPFTGLDEGSRGILKEGIDQLLDRGNPKVIIAVSRCEDLCDGVTHIAVVDDNRLIAQGERGSVIDLAKETLAQNRLAYKGKRSSKMPPFLGRMLEQYSRQLNGDGRGNSIGNGHAVPAVLIKMENVSASYGEAKVLNDISWTLRQGERWALLGANGAGKTTLMSLIVGDNPQAYANHIELFGTQRGSGESIWQIKQRIGWVSPELHLYYHRNLTAFDVVCSGFFSSNGLYHACSPDQKASAQGWMKAMQIDDLKNDPFHRLSTGQQRMVILARALVKHPPLLVLDEPCQALDDHYIEQLIQFIDCLCTVSPVSMIYVTHVRGELPSSISHLLLLRRGEIVKMGSLRDGKRDLEDIAI